MATFKPRKCLVETCGAEYLPTGPAAKYCEACSRELSLKSSRERTMQYRIKNGLVEKPYSGKGGNNKVGILDENYKSGIAYFMKNRKRIKADRGNSCERCRIDLTNASRYQWCIHHKDHDRTNNTDDNFELLCKKCHQLEHDCIAALPNEKV